ncbi:hypothetical protein BJ742DRAFT_803401 [Cladochytrium replicatum]|nr:hypothetical protein BJ742DRAFT_803401 [Cladochytrium replicatum]
MSAPLEKTQGKLSSPVASPAASSPVLSGSPRSDVGGSLQDQLRAKLKARAEASEKDEITLSPSSGTPGVQSPNNLVGSSFQDQLKAKLSSRNESLNSIPITPENKGINTCTLAKICYPFYGQELSVDTASSSVIDPMLVKTISTTSTDSNSTFLSHLIMYFLTNSGCTVSESIDPSTLSVRERMKLMAGISPPTSTTTTSKTSKPPLARKIPHRAYHLGSLLIEHTSTKARPASETQVVPSGTIESVKPSKSFSRRSSTQESPSKPPCSKCAYPPLVDFHTKVNT